MIRCIAILFYAGVLLHPLKPPRSRRERRGSDQTAVTGPGETYGESEPSVYIRDVQHTEKGHSSSRKTAQLLNPEHLSLPALSQAKRDSDGKCIDNGSCSASFLRCIIFPESTEHYCKKQLRADCKESSECVPFAICRNNKCELEYDKTNPNNGYVKQDCSCEETGCYGLAPEEESLYTWYNITARTYNIAFGRRTIGSSKESNPSCAAVNGNTRNLFCHTSMVQTSCNEKTASKNCFLTAKGDYHAYWMVDFGQAYTVTSVKLFRREESASEVGEEVSWSWLAGLRVFVDAQICFKFMGYPSDPNGFYDKLRNKYKVYTGHVRCDKPIRGRSLRLEKDQYPFAKKTPPAFQAHFNQLQLCELQVWVCDLGTFGDQDYQYCKECPSNCKHRCDNVYGCVEPVPYNVAMLKNATQSATRDQIEASSGVDGMGTSLWDIPHSKRVETGPDPETGETWWRVDLGGLFNISYIILTTAEAPGLSDFEIWVSRCITCKETRNQSGLVMCLNFTGLPKNTAAKRLDCESTVTGRYVTLLMQEKDQQTNMSFNELQVIGVDATEVSPTDCSDVSCDGPSSPNAEQKSRQVHAKGYFATVHLRPLKKTKRKRH